MQQRKKRFPLSEFTIQLTVAAGILLFLLILATPRLQVYAKGPHSSAAQSVLMELAVAEAAFSADNQKFAVGMTAADIKSLAAHGFQPAPNVGFVIVPQADEPFYVAFAAQNAIGSPLLVYAPGGNGVQPAAAAAYGGVARPVKLTLFRMNNGVVESSGPAQIELKNGKVTATIDVAADTFRWIARQ
ncbi:MAG: hypothetical protein LBV79_06665 [Candidatus Adiutrix sp.]|nr:hypothetical protein [Candidatus Adiutrix sp.]